MDGSVKMERLPMVKKGLVAQRREAMDRRIAEQTAWRERQVSRGSTPPPLAPTSPPHSDSHPQQSASSSSSSSSSSPRPLRPELSSRRTSSSTRMTEIHVPHPQTNHKHTDMQKERRSVSPREVERVRRCQYWRGRDVVWIWCGEWGKKSCR